MGLCGPSAEEKAIEARQSSLASSLSADFQSRFAGQTNILDQLNESLSPIVAAGPEQQGFSAAELAARTTQAINASGAAARNAAQVAGTEMAGRGGGGTSGLESGIDRQIRAGISTSAANQLANAELGLTAENYAVGRDKYFRALGAENALAGEFNPAQFSSQAESGFGAAFGEANKINEENNAVAHTLGGLATKALGAGLSFATGGLSNLGGAGTGTSFGENIGNFFSGGVNALANG